MSAQPGDAFGIELVEPARASLGIRDQPRFFENAEMLRNRRSADRQHARQFVHGNGPAGELLKDRHAGCVAKGVQSGL